MVAQPHARPFGTTSFIGRDQELRRLLTMWRWAADSQQPHLVTVLGEAGMGKSRLVAEFEERLPETAVVLHGTCLPYGAARSYGALEMMLKEAAGISVNDDAESARARLDQLVRSALEPDSVEGDPDELAQHLALMSGLDVEADRRTGSRDGRVFRVSARRFLTGLARRAPLCLVFDNIHWADAELLDLIEHVAAKVHSAPLLLATLARPELLENRPTWGRGVQSFTSLALQALDANTERQLILSLCREHGLPEEFAEEIARDVGGNPLYAEELVAMVAEQGREGGIPVAIKLLISARLDTLPPSERRLLQVASVFGTVFWKGGLRHLIGRDVSQELEALEQKGLLRVQARSSHPGELEFFFKHDLISEVAYEILPRAERRDLHGLVVDWLEETAGEQIEKFLDLIAHHAVEGALPEKAVTYLVRAAERAGRATAHRQKVALLDEAFAIALSLDAHDMLADIHGRRGRAFIDYGQWVSAEEALSTALALLPEDAFAERVQILCDLSWTRFWLADVAGQHEASREALALAEKLDRDDLVAKALFADGQSRTNEAKFDETLKSLHGAIERAGDAPIMEVSMAAGVSGLVYYWHGKPVEAIKYSRLAVLKGQSQQHTLPTAFAMPHLGLALAAAGRYYEAEDAFREALQFGQEYELGPFLSRAMAMSAGYHLDVFDYAGNEEIATEAREMGLSQGTPQSTWSASIDLLLNFARSHKLGAYERLFPEVVEFVEKAHGFHRWLWRMRIAEARAEVALAQGDWEEAFQWAELGITRSREFGRPKYEALGLHSRASARLVGGHKRQAIEDLRRALALARSTDDPALQLRIGTSLLEIDGDDELLTELKATATGIAATLPTERVRRAFEAAEPVKLLNRS
jgi:tetratricopeptide (TPR) repeat protein